MEIKLVVEMLVFTMYVRVGYGDISEEKKLNNSLDATTEITQIATTESWRSSRTYRREEDEDENEDMSESRGLAKDENWGGYYDFLINEGSYKFWAVFQIGTAVLLVYSAFAALYYAKVNPSTTDDYEDYFLRRKRRRRRRRRSIPHFFPLNIQTFQLIMEALDLFNYK